MYFSDKFLGVYYHSRQDVAGSWLVMLLYTETSSQKFLKVNFCGIRPLNFVWMLLHRRQYWAAVHDDMELLSFAVLCRQFAVSN